MSDLTRQQAIDNLSGYAATVDSQMCVSQREQEQLWAEFDASIAALTPDGTLQQIADAWETYLDTEKGWPSVLGTDEGLHLIRLLDALVTEGEPT